MVRGFGRCLDSHDLAYMAYFGRAWAGFVLDAWVVGASCRGLGLFVHHARHLLCRDPYRALLLFSCRAYLVRTRGLRPIAGRSRECHIGVVCLAGVCLEGTPYGLAPL